jgi:hypothetical protein
VFKWFRKELPPLEAAFPVTAGEKGRLDRHSPTWMFLSGWAAEELARLRAKNDGVSLNEVETAVIRGNIRCLKNILALPDSPGRGILNKRAGYPPQNHSQMTE